MLQFNPRMSRDEAAREVQRQEEQFARAMAEAEAALIFEFAGIRTRAALDALSPSEALARYLEAMDPRYVPDIETPRPVRRPARLCAGATRQYRVLGAVADGDTVAYVVFLQRDRAGSWTPPDWAGVIPLRNEDDLWMVARLEFLQVPRPGLSRGCGSAVTVVVIDREVAPR